MGISFPVWTEITTFFVVASASYTLPAHTQEHMDDQESEIHRLVENAEKEQDGGSALVRFPAIHCLE